MVELLSLTREMRFTAVVVAALIHGLVIRLR